ncbi:hypothetical protein D187_010306 [Cystobacter fuscus DSM 2262]|uniref:Uncharacterized protein n=1 Tax=Cystobacter fuscus (strain ATCC 25194 / DSM 2262 / NBRC 100088 / M29) TaxID=1242864 RepID=S9PH05_CYSF2|nr:hypothetical protein [Cystobacter fuscus]EPX61687.1 hypothetical protein D187_010306 [Cystobacter fuscus DSM 2262]
MLRNMSPTVFNGLAAVTVAIPILAWSYGLPVHNVRSSALDFFSERNAQNQHIDYTVGSSSVTFSWQENSLHGFGNLSTKVGTKDGTGHMFELKLVRITSSDANTVNGEWDVFKNGDPTCAGCKGSLYVTSPGQGYEYLKGYVDNGKVGYSFSGPLDAKTRYDY